MNSVHSQTVSLIWNIADDVLRDIFVRGQYRDVILPMVVLRRLDALLESTKVAVEEEMKLEKENGFDDLDEHAIKNITGLSYYNTSRWTLARLKQQATGDNDILYDNFAEYLNGFSKNVSDVLTKFEFFAKARKLADRNGSVPVQEGAYMFDIPFFNEEVIREVINNAFAHRDYRLASEIVIKQYPTKLSVISPGGFPIGVTLENILTVSSTPRNRLLADVLAATGIVERSGQGMDVIFRLTLSEGKQTPDYSKTNDYQVTAILSATVKDPGFALFIKSIQQELPENQKLSVFDVLTFCAIREGKQPKDKEIAKRLYSMGYLEKRGKTSAIRYILPRRYYELTGNQSEYSELTDWDDEQIWSVLFRYLKKYGTAKKTDIAKLIGQHISDSQLRRLLERLSEGPNPPLIKEGKTRNLTYSLSKDYLGQVDLLNEATRRGLSQMIQEVTQQNASFKTSIKSSDEINDEINT